MRRISEEKIQKIHKLAKNPRYVYQSGVYKGKPKITEIAEKVEVGRESVRYNLDPDTKEYRKAYGRNYARDPWNKEYRRLENRIKEFQRIKRAFRALRVPKYLQDIIALPEEEIDSMLNSLQ